MCARVVANNYYVGEVSNTYEAVILLLILSVGDGVGRSSPTAEEL